MCIGNHSFVRNVTENSEVFKVSSNESPKWLFKQILQTKKNKRCHDFSNHSVPYGLNCDTNNERACHKTSVSVSEA